MFTGLISAVGKVLKYAQSHLTIAAPYRGVEVGESISVDGVCLTVTAKKGRQLAFDVGPETRRVTTLRDFSAGRRVNLERALRRGERFGGHCVLGHVETTGLIVALERAGTNHWLTICLPRKSVRYVIPKGSIAIDGISLTVASIKGRTIRIMIIPHTWNHTALANKRVGDAVNVETDVIGKYAERLLRRGRRLSSGQFLHKWVC